ncbi:MAG TPA: argininosuccinate lyase [Oligoflexia bacterium]|nr:argininosuccinate lyase [Oligoflexia bacterium]
MSKRLWDKGEELDQLIHQFTVGNDPAIDRALVYHDAVGSAAHARMLRSIDLLTEQELRSLLEALRDVCRLSEENRFDIPPALEDCHTAIEEFLVRRVGDAGKKIHAGRSRNDQVLLAMRLYLRSQTVSTMQSLVELCQALLCRLDEAGNVPMPGYTHFQPAMPSSVGLWLHAFVEALLELTGDGLALLERINANPLGAASGFGVPLPLDRSMVTDLLAFSRTQRSPIDTQNSRGRHELKFLRWGADIAGVIEKFAWDLILYTSQEFGFFTLPQAFTTGSSIMPQKHNPDVLELLRARAAKVRAAESELLLVCAKLPSNYHRDFQYTKEPVMRTVKNLDEMLIVLQRVVSSFGVNEEKLRISMTAELYATYDACREVRNGIPFREAYRLTAERIKNGQLDQADLAKDFSFISGTLAAETMEAREELLSSAAAIEQWAARFAQAEVDLFAE